MTIYTTVVNMIKINPYLNFAGTTEEAFQFYKSVFGGEFSLLMRFKETPDGGKAPEADREKIMHVSLPVGNVVLMATDMLESMGQKLVAGNNFSLMISTESEEEADQLFQKLSAGGTIGMPLEKTFWGAYFGTCTDKFGMQWMVSYEYKK